MTYVVIAVLLILIVEGIRLDRRYSLGSPISDFWMGVIWYGGIVIAVGLFLYGSWEANWFNDWIYRIFPK